MESNDTNSTNTTDDDHFIDNDWALPKSYHVLFAILYTLTIIFSIVGNVLEMVVLVVRKRLSVDVRYSLVNLAVADIMMAVFCIPFTYSQYVNGEWLYSIQMCAFILFMEEVIVMVSVLSLTAIGVNRYLAILHPFKCRWIKSYKAILYGVVIIWVFSIGTCAVIPFYAKVYSLPGYNWCSNGWPTTEGEMAYAWIKFLFLYVIPLAVLVFAYSSIAWKLLTNVVPGSTNSERDDRRHQKRIKTIKMLAAIVILFALCWAPFHIFTLISWVDANLLNHIHPLTNKILWATFHWLAMANSFVNPIVYSLGNNDFCKDLLDIFNKLIGRSIKNDVKYSNESTTSTNTSKNGP